MTVQADFLPLGAEILSADEPQEAAIHWNEARTAPEGRKQPVIFDTECQIMCEFLQH